MSYKKRRLTGWGTRELDRLVKCLPVKHEDQCSALNTHVNLGKKELVPGEVKGPKGEGTGVILANGHDVKLPCNYGCLYSQVGDALYLHLIAVTSR